jgi:hypothetical protein
MSSAELAKKLSDIPKGKAALSEAIKELELSKQAFSSAGQIHEKLLAQEMNLQELKKTLEHLVPINYLNTRIEDLTLQLDKVIRNRVEELSVSILSHLNNKITTTDAENLVNKKVSWTEFNTLNQQVGMMRSKLDKHIYADFEGFKTKMKLEISNKTGAKKAQESSNDEILQIKTRLSSIEQQISQLFNEEEVLDEDHDSQEELDNMMSDLERVVLKDRKSHDFSENFEVKPNDIEKLQPVPLNDTPPVENIDDNKIDIKPLPIQKIEEGLNSPRNRESLKKGESKTILRRNSKESSIAASRSIGGGNSAAVRIINKKIAILEKELEDNKTIFEDVKNDTKKIYSLIEQNDVKIDETNLKCKEINERLEIMQGSFLRALRRSGIPKEKVMPVEKPVVKSNAKELENINKNVEENFKRLIKTESDILKTSNDLTSIKLLIKDKLSEVMSTIKNFPKGNGRKQSIEKRL